MNSAFVRMVSRALVVCMAVLPFQAQAVLIGTGDAAAARATVHRFVDRADVAGKLQALGIAPRAAQERVATLSDAEAASLAERIDSLPAGANGGGVGFILVLLFLIWRFFFSEQAQADAAKSAPKPAAKPAAEQKK